MTIQEELLKSYRIVRMIPKETFGTGADMDVCRANVHVDDNLIITSIWVG